MSSPVVTPTISLQTVELVSTLRVAPANGAPSSLDYNDGEQEKLVDLTSLASFINDTLLPILNALPSSAATGLEGTTVFSDTTAQDALVYNSLSQTSLSVTDSMRLLYGQLQTMLTTQTDLSQQIASLNARLSASNQNDLSLALQALTSTLTQQQTELTSLANAISSLQLLAGTTLDARVQTPNVQPQDIESIQVLWSVPFNDNTYTVSYGLEDPSGFLQINGFSYLPNGTGVLVRVYNSDPNAAHQGFVHAQGRDSQLASSN